ncbi:cytochrome P450 [Crassisporium funariophilum]|nr:cytochrome P450 [Crassisporium funariophilum]
MSLTSYQQLDHIPTIGYSSPFLSFFSAVKFLLGGREIIEEGYRKYPGQIWKLPTLEEWLIVANGTQRVEDIRKASEDHLSGTRSSAVFYQWDHTIGAEVTANPYHINVVRGPLTRNIASQFDDMREEMLLALDDLIPCGTTDWVAVPVFDSLVELISRISSRAFVGLPLCRDVEFRKLCINSTMELVKGRLLHLLPVFMRPLVGKLITNVDAVLLSMENHLRPVVEYRLKQERIYGADWPDKPSDIITWTLEGAKAAGEERTVRNMAKRMLLFSFASTHTSSVAFSQVLYELASRPEYIQPLRDEVEAVMDNDGWTKAAVGKLHKMDSFLRETQRCNGLGLVLLTRRVLKDFTFSDGTFIPAGSSLCVNSWGIHHDETLYPSADSFDGFRFTRGSGTNQQLTATPTLEYTAFGHGRPACPGRFFAVAELKMMLAHFVTTYDMKLENELPPPMMWLESKVMPDTSIKLMFRKRDSL